jgi:hypothetical protein
MMMGMMRMRDSFDETLEDLDDDLLEDMKFIKVWIIMKWMMMMMIKWKKKIEYYFIFIFG